MKRNFGKCPRTPELDLKDEDKRKNKQARRGYKKLTCKR
jgi:hypothetical protein